MKYDIYIDGEISRYWGINAAYIKDALKDIKDEQPISVYISSLGGDVNEALKIRQIFIDRKGKVTAYIYGFTASAATIIATGADEIVQSNAALQLVHQASQWVDTFGQMNKDQIAEAIRKLQEQAEDLATVDGVIASLYVTRYGLTEAEAKELMTAARWLDAKTCKEKGLCDRIIEAKDDKPAKEAQAHAKDRFAAMGLPPAPEQTENSFTNLTDNTMEKKETKIEAFFNALKALFMGEEENPETEPEKKKEEDPAPDPEPEKEEDPKPEEENPEKKEDAPEEKCDPEKKETTENSLEAEIENLKAQIAALKKADGADTITIEGGAEDEYNAAKAYEQLKGII